MTPPPSHRTIYALSGRPPTQGRGVSRLRRFVAGLLMLSTGYDVRPVYVIFLVTKMTDRVLSDYLGFPLTESLHHISFIYHRFSPFCYLSIDSIKIKPDLWGIFVAKREHTEHMTIILAYTQPPIQCTPGISRGVNRPGSGVDHLSLSSAEVKERVELYLPPMGLRGLL
jgi:hypothetical protein